MTITLNKSSVILSEYQKELMYEEFNKPITLTTRQESLYSTYDSDNCLKRMVSYIAENPQRLLTPAPENHALAVALTIPNVFLTLVGPLLANHFIGRVPPTMNAKLIEIWNDWEKDYNFHWRIPPGDLPNPERMQVVKKMGKKSLMYSLTSTCLYTLMQIRSIIHSNEYGVWCQARHEMFTHTAIEKFIAEDPVLNKLFCPITHALPLEPVRAPNHITYERSAIEDWLRLHPHTEREEGGPVFGIEDVEIDLAHANAVTTRMRKIMKALIANPQRDIQCQPYNPTSFVKALQEKSFAFTKGKMRSYAKICTKKQDLYLKKMERLSFAGEPAQLLTQGFQRDISVISDDLDNLVKIEDPLHPNHMLELDRRELSTVGQREKGILLGELPTKAQESRISTITVLSMKAVWNLFLFTTHYVGRTDYNLK